MSEPTNDLERYFRSNDKRLIYKWMHYFEVYERHFSKYRNREVVILEIGVFQGGSLQMWKEYFGDKARIYGLDVNPECKKLEEENIRIFTGSQSDRNFLRNLKKQIPRIDILIDDGGHTMTQQIVTFEELYDHVKDDGVYLCEDIHTSYWLKFGGGYRRRGTFIEYTKHFIDRLNAYHSEQSSLQVSDFTRTTNSIHYYDSIIVLEKRRRVEPYQEKTGTPSFVAASVPDSPVFRLKQKTLNIALTASNKLLRFFRLGSVKWK